MVFLEAGLHHAELTMETQAAHRAFLQGRDVPAYHAALQRLDDYRATIEEWCVSNLAFLRGNESYTWDRRIGPLLAGPHERLPDAWWFALDPGREGETKGWFAGDFDASAWPKAGTDGTWEKQEV